MNRLFLAFWLILPLFAANVPNRYIVELSTEPVAVRVRGEGRGALHGAAAERHRTRLRSEQAALRLRVEQAEGAVTGSIENLENALVVRIDDAKAGRLARLPGARKVYPVREFHLMLDHALPLHRIPEAWSQVGIGNAGAGVKIAIIDTGVDASHPGFQDCELPALPGFPRGDAVYTNSKIIVARSYVSLLPAADPDLSPADHVGHGTATAMAAAGARSAGPLATITGVAPRAYIGSYKVFGSPAANLTTTEDAVLRAIDDAVADGMDILNLSLGNDVPLRLEDDLEMQALENAAVLGIVVVCAAGNNGPDPMTVGTPAATPSAITVGATANDRLFAARVITPDRQYAAVPANNSMAATPVTAALADVSALDGDGLACRQLPPNALAGAIALISRGTCTFEIKLNNAQAAGATAAVVFNNVDDPSITMLTGAATLPAEMVSKADGITLRALVSPANLTMDFTLTAFYAGPAHMESFSSIGPASDFSIKPDLAAVGGDVYTAAQKLDRFGAVYSATGYAIENGTSFSAPIVAGSAAVLKSARPGLTAAQYRSLLVNTAAAASGAPGTPAGMQQAGAGALDLLSAINATSAAGPVSLSFGAGTGAVHETRSLTLWNLGSSAEDYQISVAALHGDAVPTVPLVSVQVDAGGSATIPVSFSADGLAPGQYEGFLWIQGNRSNVPLRVPYWYGVGSGRPRRITILSSAPSGPAGNVATDAVVFRVTDDSGLPVTDVQPAVTVLSGGGSALAARPVLNAPYAFDVDAMLGDQPGANVFRIQVGEITRDVTIIGR